MQANTSLSPGLVQWISFGKNGENPGDVQMCYRWASTNFPAKRYSTTRDGEKGGEGVLLTKTEVHECSNRDDIKSFSGAIKQEERCLPIGVDVPTKTTLSMLLEQLSLIYAFACAPPDLHVQRESITTKA